MRSLTLILLLALCGSAAAQKGREEESQYLRNLSYRVGAKSVAEAKSGTLPAAAPLKVFVLAPSQYDLCYRFEEWVEAWNRTEGEKHGRVEVVREPAQADVILARFLTPFKTKKYNEPRGEELWTVTGSGGRVGTPLPPPGVPAQAPPAHVSHSAKVYAYVAAREADGLKLLWRGTDTVRVRGTRPSDASELGNLKGEKDSKAAGDKLRDQFFKLLKARAGQSHD
jgi:hypothetical protein